MAAVSISEVARRAGVSRATVSRVLNGNTADLVAPRTRERVHGVARALGYHPNAVARALAGKPMNTIGVVMAYDLPSVTSDPYLGPVLDGILEANKRFRQKTVLFTEDDWQFALENLPTYCDGHCDGLLLIAPCIDSAIVPALQRRGRPFLLIGDSREDPDISSVDVDNAAMTLALTEHLIAQGHRRIAILCGNDQFTSNTQRVQGFRQAMERAGLLCDETLVVKGEYWEWSGYQNTERLLSWPLSQRPTALLCSNGRIAVGALQALGDNDLHVPRDMAVAACCENASDGLTSPRISAAYMPLRQIGQKAIETLLAQIYQGTPTGDHILLPAERITLSEATS